MGECFSLLDGDFFYDIVWVWCVKECLSLCHLVCVCERVFDEFG